MYFIPSVHTLVVRCNAEISLKNVLRYFSTALNIIEPDMFDVDVIVQRDILERIINAHLVTHLYANISFLILVIHMALKLHLMTNLEKWELDE